jgi:hypothetical protein
MNKILFLIITLIRFIDADCALSGDKKEQRKSKLIDKWIKNLPNQLKHLKMISLDEKKLTNLLYNISSKKEHRIVLLKTLAGVRSSTLNAELRKKNPDMSETFHYGVKVYSKIIAIQKKFHSLQAKDSTDNFIFDLTPLEEAIHSQSNFKLPHKMPQTVKVAKYENHKFFLTSKVSNDKKYLEDMLTIIYNSTPQRISYFYQKEYYDCEQDYSEKRKNPNYRDQEAFDEAYKFYFQNEIIMQDGRFIDSTTQGGHCIAFRTMDRPGIVFSGKLFFGDQPCIDLRALEKKCLENSNQVTQYEIIKSENTPRSNYGLFGKIVSLIRFFLRLDQNGYYE